MRLAAVCLTIALLFLPSSGLQAAAGYYTLSTEAKLVLTHITEAEETKPLPKPEPRRRCGSIVGCLEEEVKKPIEESGSVEEPGGGEGGAEARSTATIVIRQKEVTYLPQRPKRLTAVRENLKFSGKLDSWTKNVLRSEMSSMLRKLRRVLLPAIQEEISALQYSKPTVTKTISFKSLGATKWKGHDVQLVFEWSKPQLRKIYFLRKTPDGGLVELQYSNLIPGDIIRVAAEYDTRPDFETREVLLTWRGQEKKVVVSRSEEDPKKFLSEEILIELVEEDKPPSR
jgi:hypothetical protein